MSCEYPSGTIESTQTVQGCYGSYDSAKAATYANGKGGTKPYPGGCCAAWTKTYIHCTEGGNLSSKRETWNAATGYHWLKYYGFKPLLSGNTRKVPENFTPQEGDILVAAACAQHPYGHIQIWTNGKWVADTNYEWRAGVYQNYNYWTIFRK